MTVHYAVFAFSGDFSYSFLSHSSGERIHNIAKDRAEEFVEDVPVACSTAIVSFATDIKFIYRRREEQQTKRFLSL
jgi:hypothetical protein